jgi:hypothetical protein
MENHLIDKHAYERLHSEVAELLLKPDSLARTTEEIKPLFQEYQSLQARQGELKSLEIKIAEMIPVIEQTEVEVAKAKRQLADEEKVLGTFAEELGRSVFAGFQAGVILDQPFLSPRKELQVRIDELQAKRSILQSEQRTGLLEKTKQQAHLLALAGQIKFEEVNVGSTDRLVGEAILGSKEKLTIKCSYTEQVLKAIIEQQQRIAPARGKLKSAEELVIQRKAECGAKLGRAAVQSSDLKSELKELRGEAVRNTKQMNGLREQVVDVAIKSEVAMLDATINLKLRELRKLQESQAANRFQFANRLGPVMDLLKKLPAGKRRTVLLAGGSILCLLFLGLVGRALFRGEENSLSPKLVKAWEDAGATFRSEYAGGPHFTIGKWKNGMISNLPRPNFSFSLDLTGSGITNEGLREITALHQLRSILLSENDISDQGLESISNLGDLTEIVLNKTKVSDDGLKQLAKLKKLKYLYLEDTKVSDAGIKHLVDLNELAVLYLSGTKITDAALTKIWKYEKLNSLRLAKTLITDVGLESVGKVSGLQELDLAETEITDSGLKNLEKLTHLSMLTCDNTQITDRGLLKIAAKFKELEFLDLDGTRVSDVGLAFLSEMKSLKSVSLLSCPNVSQEGVKVLESKTPNLKVYYTPAELLEEMLQGKKPASNTQDNDTASHAPTTVPTFRYMFNGKSYTGAIEQDNGIELVFYDPKDPLLSLTIDKSTSTVVSSFLGVTKGRLHLGGGKENILLQLSFFLEGQPSKGPTRMLPTSRDELGDNSAKVRGSIVANYLRPGPSYKTHWFGRPASNVPKEEQEIVLRKGSSVLVGFGVPFKIEAETEVVRVQYAEFSPSGQLAMLKKFIGDPGLQFIIGDRTLQIDDNTRRTLFLLERAVAVLRYHQGARDNASRQSLGD